MKKRININRQYLNFINVKAFVTDTDGYFYQKRKGRGFFYDTKDVIINIDFIEQISLPVKEEIFIKNYSNTSYTTKDLYFFRIKLSSGENIFVSGENFTKFKFLLNNE